MSLINRYAMLTTAPKRINRFLCENNATSSEIQTPNAIANRYLRIAVIVIVTKTPNEVGSAQFVYEAHKKNRQLL